VVAVNGIDALTGEYLLPGLTSSDLAAAVHVDGSDRSTKELLARHRATTERVYAPRYGIDAADLTQAGWGAVFAADADPAVRSALRPLLEHRQSQAGAQVERRYREFAGLDGLRHGESKQAFTRRHGSGPGPVDPDVMPYTCCWSEIPKRSRSVFRRSWACSTRSGACRSTSSPPTAATPSPSSQPKQRGRVHDRLSRSSPRATTATARRR
jgi:hypothetical protein